MSYTPTEWKTGDVVTSAKLNKLEQGVADAGLGAMVATFTFTEDGITCDKTYSEINAAYQSGGPGAVIGYANGAFSNSVVRDNEDGVYWYTFYFWVRYLGDTFMSVACTVYSSGDPGVDSTTYTLTPSEEG